VPPVALPAFAQEGGITATLRGTVADASGAVLPGASVTLTNTGTQASQTVPTDDRGSLLFTGLWPGTYDLKIALSGFKTSEQHGIVLSPNDTRGISITLEVGSQTETVIVSASPDVIRTADRRARRRRHTGSNRQPAHHRPRRAGTAANPARRRRARPERLRSRRSGRRRRRTRHEHLRERRPLCQKCRESRWG